MTNRKHFVYFRAINMPENGSEIDEYEIADKFEEEDIDR